LASSAQQLLYALPPLILPRIRTFRVCYRGLPLKPEEPWPNSFSTSSASCSPRGDTDAAAEAATRSLSEKGKVLMQIEAN